MGFFGRSVSTDPVRGSRRGRRQSRYRARSHACALQPHLVSVARVFYTGCSTAVNDLVYVVDGSWSVGVSDFDSAKQWLINITSQFDISSDYTQVKSTKACSRLSLSSSSLLTVEFFTFDCFCLRLTVLPLATFTVGGCGPVQRCPSPGDSSGQTSGRRRSHPSHPEHRLPGRKHAGRTAFTVLPLCCF